MPNLSFYERQHLEKLIQQEASLKYIFDEYVRNVSILMSGWQDSGNENVWIRNAHIEKGVEKELQALHDKLTANITNNSVDAWNRSNRKTDDLIEGYIKDMSLNEVVKKGMFARNEEALKTFLKAKIDGETVSDRVWKVTGGGKEAIEHYLSSGISTGRPATAISQDIRQLLNDPDKRFRRIRNEQGKLVMSQPMKDYHPGQGVYRSSFMNAKRLAATETNRAYRTADFERWNKLDFILGVEVRRSASNKGPCAICDAMVGRYPKDYKFAGNHPWCICVATPILMDEDDFINALVDDDFSNVKYIEDIPAKSREYLEKQLSKDNVSVNSYLFRDNKKFFDGRSKAPENLLIKQNSEINTLMAKAKDAGPQVEKTAQDIADKYNATVTPINYKSFNSITRKVNNELDGDVSKVKDSVRNTIIVPRDNMSSVYNTMKSDSKFVRVKMPLHETDEMGYSGILSNFKADNGIFAEVQANTPKMIYAKEPPESAKIILGDKKWNEIYSETGLQGGLGHKYYEEYRILPPESSDALKIRELSKKYYSNFLD